jgi:hypothetical protein
MARSIILDVRRALVRDDACMAAAKAVERRACNLEGIMANIRPRNVFGNI